MSRAMRSWGLMAGMAFLATGIMAQGTAGPEFEINSYTTSDQEQPTVAQMPNGDFIVVWKSEGSTGTDASEKSVQGQLFSADGTPQGGEFQINTYTTGEQTGARVATDANGDFVVTWFSYGSAGGDSDWSIQAQLYDAAGTPLGSEFQVNSHTTSFQYSPAVARADDGRFVIAWASDGSSGSDTDGWSIHAQRFDANGIPQGSEFEVNTHTTGDQTDAGLAMLPNGDFVVVWESYGSDGTDTLENSIQGRRYLADGTPLGSQFQVNSYTTSYQWSPAIGMSSNGEFVVAWTSVGSSGTDTSNRSVQARRFLADGTPLAADFQVNTFTMYNQVTPAVAVDGGGDFVVTWTSDTSSGSDGSYTSIQGRRYAANGAPLGADFQVNSFTSGEQRRSSVATLDGSAIVVWDSAGSGGTDQDGLSVQGQRYDPILIFIDGFESGDTSAWTTTVP